MADSIVDQTVAVVGNFLAGNTCPPEYVPTLVKEVGHAIMYLDRLERGEVQSEAGAFDSSSGLAVAGAGSLTLVGGSATQEEGPMVPSAPAAATPNLLSHEDSDGRTVVQLETRRPAVPIEESVKDDYIVCLEDGRRMKVLKRHLRTKYNMSPEEYRRRWGLPPEYPVVAPNYARLRSRIANTLREGGTWGSGVDSQDSQGA